MQAFKALVASKAEKGPELAWKELTVADLMDGDVVVEVSHSTVNYKDGLALTGKAPVIRRWPMIPGIDFAGTVVSSHPRDWKAGDEVILNGWGCRRDALRRLRPDGARQGRLAGGEASRNSRPPRPWPSAPPAIRPCCACWRWSATASIPRAGRWW